MMNSKTAPFKNKKEALPPTSSLMSPAKNEATIKKTPVNVQLNQRDINALDVLKDYLGEVSNATTVRKAILIAGYLAEQSERGRLILTSDRDGGNVREIVLI